MIVFFTFELMYTRAVGHLIVQIQNLLGTITEVWYFPLHTLPNKIVKQQGYDAVMWSVLIRDVAMVYI